MRARRVIRARVREPLENIGLPEGKEIRIAIVEAPAEPIAVVAAAEIPPRVTPKSHAPLVRPL